jgi:hypothetical protein
MPVGRPPKLTDEQREEVYTAFDEYIRNEPDPTVVHFVSSDETAMQYNVSRDNINDWEEFSTLQKKAIQKQEAYLLRNGGRGVYNPTMAIFRLKQPQHGYKDRIDSDITTGGEKIDAGISSSQVEQLLRARATRDSSDL